MIPVLVNVGLLIAFMVYVLVVMPWLLDRYPDD